MSQPSKNTEAISSSAAPEPVNGTTKDAELPAANTQGEEPEEHSNEDSSITLTVVLPHEPKTLQIIVLPHEQVHEIRQSVIEIQGALQYSCFHLEHLGARINDFVQVSEIKGLRESPELKLVEDPYTEKEARIHLVRIRELIGAAGDRTDTAQGMLAGTSLYDDVSANIKDITPLDEYDFDAPPSVSTLLPRPSDPAPKTVKAISLSPWNPPPAYLRQKGHLLYILITTNEGEQYQVTAHVGGFFVNKSSNSKFDPFPKAAPKARAAHSLLTLLEEISPSFSSSFRQLQEYNGRKDLLAIYQMGNAIPAASWIVPAPSSSACAHVSDITRTQETFLFGGVENTETLRDWNEEFQSARELPKESVQDRIFRERLIMKLFADYNEAAARGAVLVARGEVAPLNPTEGRDAQIFVYNNIFFSFGADGVGTYTTEGGDEAARVATGKDVAGVKFVNSLDIQGLHTPCTVVVDFLGKRIVAQSIVPGIFKQPEPGENQIQYGAVDGKDVVSTDERFVALFEKLAKAIHVKKHAVWDKEDKRFDLETSVETKGLIGTDGRKYVLDLYRIAPLDVSWLEGQALHDGPEYPHRMCVLRQELIEAYRKHKLREWLSSEAAKRAQRKTDTKTDGEAAKADTDVQSTEVPPKDQVASEDEKLDASEFQFALNPDVFSGQRPQTEAEKEQMAADERDVRDACTYLQEVVIPGFVNELSTGDIGFPLDGRTFTRLIHKRGINMRYIGKIATLAESTRLQGIKTICVREMVSRSFKHVAAKHLKQLSLPLSSSCIAHLLNCLVGQGFNSKPVAEIDDSLRSLYEEADMAFEKVTPESLKREIEEETLKRFRFVLEDGWLSRINHLPLLREICLKLGVQLQAKDYSFSPAAEPRPPPGENGHATDDATNALDQKQTNGESKKKRKKARDGSPASTASSATASASQTFSPDDILNFMPLVKDSSPRSSLAEEAFEAGRLSVFHDQKELGQELLLESLSLYEQIYGLLHPEVAQLYYALSQIYSHLGERELAVDLARKSVIVAERTFGVDSGETVLDYLNLSLLLYQSGDSGAAVVYAKHALNLWHIVYGPDHPDTTTAINNVAVILQHLKAYHESRRWFEEALRICEKHFGRQSVGSATMLFQLAQALALDQDSKGAVNRMRESYSIFLSELGAEDKNTKEAESWLEQLTQNAVSVAKHAKDVQARRLRAGIRFTPRSLGGMGPTAALGTGRDTPAAAAAAAADQPPAIDSRSIDELLKFIEGSPKQKKTSSKKRPGRNGTKTARQPTEGVATTA